MEQGAPVKAPHSLCLGRYDVGSWEGDGGVVEMGNNGLEEPDALNFLHKGNASVM